MTAFDYMDSQDLAFDQIKAAFPEVAEDEIHFYMDLCEDDGTQPSVEGFKDYSQPYVWVNPDSPK